MSDDEDEREFIDEENYIREIDGFQELISRDPDKEYSLEKRRLGEIAKIFSVLDKPEKILVFYEASQRNSLTDVEESVNVSSSTIYNYVDDFVEADLMDRKTDSGRKYQATELGDYVYRMICQLDLMVVIHPSYRREERPLQDHPVYEQIRDFEQVHHGLLDEDS
jgi:predicted transcriptional regulator